MLKKLLTPLIFFLLGAISNFVFNLYGTPFLEELTITLFIIAGLTFLGLLIRSVIESYVTSSRIRYTFRKTTSIALVVLMIIVILRIWVEDPQALLVAYGLVAAGIAVALQDVFKNIAGGIIILATGLYRVGNRIELDGKQGDVIDTGIFYTTLLEVGEWVKGDQATGRIVTIPNGKVLSGILNNYTRDHHYLWDEIAIPITYNSDLEKAIKILTDVARARTIDFSKQASESFSSMKRQYFLSERNTEPSVFVQATDNWILLTVRYVVETRERRVVNSNIGRDIITQIQQADGIQIASETLKIVDFPENK